jgi:hypothetical protein
MPDWILPIWERAGLPVLILIAMAMGTHNIFYKAVWPFFLTELWPQIKLSLEYSRHASSTQSAQLQALYNVILKISNDQVAVNIRLENAIERMMDKFEKELRAYTAAVSDALSQLRRVQPFLDPPNAPKRRHYEKDVSDEH